MCGLDSPVIAVSRAFTRLIIGAKSYTPDTEGEPRHTRYTPGFQGCTCTPILRKGVPRCDRAMGVATTRFAPAICSRVHPRFARIRHTRRRSRRVSGRFTTGSRAHTPVATPCDAAVHTPDSPVHPIVQGVYRLFSIRLRGSFASPLRDSFVAFADPSVYPTTTAVSSANARQHPRCARRSS